MKSFDTIQYVQYVLKWIKKLRFDLIWIAPKQIVYSSLKSEENFITRNQIIYNFYLYFFSYLSLFSQKMDTNLKFLSENIHSCCTSFAYLAIAA